MERPALPPLKRLGQHFLVDKTAIARIVEAARPEADERIVEIGPGRGALTEPLLERHPPLTVVEFDRALAAWWSARAADAPLTVLAADALKLDWARIDAPCGFVLISNLPYNISKPLALKLCDEVERVRRAVLMFQREVAQRLLASAGSKEYGPLGILCSHLFAIHRAFDLEPRAFRPSPEVRSTVTIWQRLESRPSAQRLTELRRLLAAAFLRRRKTLRGNLRSSGWPISRVDRALERLGLPASCRAEQIAQGQWLPLLAALEANDLDGPTEPSA